MIALRSACCLLAGLLAAPGEESTPPEPELLAPTGEGAFARALRETQLQPELDALIASLRAVSRREALPGRLARVTHALEEPLALPELARAVAAPTHDVVARPWRAAALLAAENLDAGDVRDAGHGTLPVGRPMAGIFALDFFLNEARLHVQAALGERFADEAFARRAIAAARGLRESMRIEESEAEATLALARAGAEIDMSALVAAIAHLDAGLDLGAGWADAAPKDLPEELTGAVTGTILSVMEIPEIGWAIVGGAGPNEYDMSVVAAVLDIGGDDRYFLSGLALGMRGIIDLAGNDRYEGSAEQGIAAGICGLFFVDDHEGDDVYAGGALHAGVGLFGAGILIDRAGNDRYEGKEWTQGAACWGAGILIDLDGNDLYVADYLGQGCGGPRGFGALVDAHGNDRYDAQGSRASHYDTPTVTAAFSQGVGVGFRRVAAGGIGLLADLAGDDRYEAGEFAQGGAYYFALGILYDKAGDDCYWGNRYGQGFAAHQAAGALADEGGNDLYVGMTAANQGAAWDQSVAILLDAGGDDVYRADGLAQGAAAQQALACLIDLGGDDRYFARGVSVQGHSGGNEYHFDEAPPFGGVLSFSVLLDLLPPGAPAGCDDFSSGRGPGRPMRTGSGAAGPEARLHGLFFAEPAPSSAP